MMVMLMVVLMMVVLMVLLMMAMLMVVLMIAVLTVVLMMVTILLVVKEEEIHEKGMGNDEEELILLCWLNKQLGQHDLYNVHTNN